MEVFGNVQFKNVKLAVAVPSGKPFWIFLILKGLSLMQLLAAASVKHDFTTCFNIAYFLTSAYE